MENDLRKNWEIMRLRILKWISSSDYPPVKAAVASVLLSEGGAHCASIVHNAGNVTPYIINTNSRRLSHSSIFFFTAEIDWSFAYFAEPLEES